MNGAQDGTVARRGAYLRQRLIERVLRHVAQHLFAEEAADRLQLAGDRGVLVGQIRVIRPGINDAQRVARSGKVEGDPLHLRVLLVIEVDEDHAAHAGCHLVHQAAGLPEIDVFGILADLRDLHRVQPVLKKQAVQDVADLSTKGGRKFIPVIHAGSIDAAFESVADDGVLRMISQDISGFQAGITARNTTDGDG